MKLRQKGLLFGTLLIVALALFTLTSFDSAEAQGPVTVSITDGNGVALSDASTYHIIVEGVGGTYGDGQEFTPPGATYRYQIRTVTAGGTITTGWITDNSGSSTLNVQYASLTVDLYNNGTQLTPASTYHLIIERLAGQHGDEAVVHLPPNINVRYQARTVTSGGTITTGWITFNTGAPGTHVLDVEYATVTVHLHNGTTDLDSTVDTNYHVIFERLAGTHENGAIVHLPPGIDIRYQVRTVTSGGTITTGWITEDDLPAGDSVLDIQYAAVQLRLYNGDTELNSTVDTNYHVIFERLAGTHEYGAVVNLPAGIDIRYQVRTVTSGGTITTGWITKEDLLAGDSTMEIEYATVQLHLFNGGTELDSTPDVAYHVIFERLAGTHENGDIVHLPPGIDIRYQIRTVTSSGTITTGWITEEDLLAGDSTMEIEYATVQFRFSGLSGNCLGTFVERYGTIARNGTGHFPPNVNIRIRADICGLVTGWFTQNFPPSDGTITWTFDGVYVHPDSF